MLIFKCIKNNMELKRGGIMHISGANFLGRVLDCRKFNKLLKT